MNTVKVAICLNALLKEYKEELKIIRDISDIEKTLGTMYSDEYTKMLMRVISDIETVLVSGNRN